MKNKAGLCYARHLLIVQVGLIIVMAALCFLLSINASFSVILGGLVCLLPQAIFAKQLFKKQEARFAKQIATQFYKGEALKLLLTALMFALVLRYFRVDAVIFFTGYVVVLFVSGVAPLLLFKATL